VGEHAETQGKQSDLPGVEMARLHPAMTTLYGVRRVRGEPRRLSIATMMRTLPRAMDAAPQSVLPSTMMVNGRSSGKPGVVDRGAPPAPGKSTLRKITHTARFPMRASPSGVSSCNH
jgi:hypothetical protein